MFGMKKRVPAQMRHSLAIFLFLFYTLPPPQMLI